MASSTALHPPLALLSVSDKSGIVPFARRLSACGFTLVSTGGTARALRDAGLSVRDVSDLTQFPEMLDGRVKTLHPRIHGGLLGRWDLPDHRRQMELHGILPISLVAVNLYPFEQVAQRLHSSGVTRAELIENIDIGGPSMLRSAAKNSDSVTVLVDPADYDPVASELEHQGLVSPSTRWRLAQKVFARTAAYDAAIAAVLATLPPSDGQPGAAASPAVLPDHLQISAPRLQPLRYGENPHQQAALYSDPSQPGGLAHARLLHGKELSFNNLVDLDAACELATEFDLPAAAIIKHTNPAGCASASSLAEAYDLALACDPVSAYGGVVGLNRIVDASTAQAMAQLFLECIAAPRFSPEALEILGRKKNLRLVEVSPASPPLRFRSISGGFLLQTSDDLLLNPDRWRVVTQLSPTSSQQTALLFAWAVAKHVKSNAIVFARAFPSGACQTLAVGAGQMSRVDAVKIAAMKAQLPLHGAAVASDAFFPFPDGIEAAVSHGASCFIQPGGSVHDADCIAACDRLHVAMLFTGIRHFRH